MSTRVIRLTCRARDLTLENVRAELTGLGLWTTPLLDPSGRVEALLVSPQSRAVGRNRLLAIDGVADVLEPPSPHPRVDAQANRGVVAGPVVIGGDAPPVLIAGPCGVESRAQIRAAAAMASSAGARLLRGGAYKPRTSPYSFTGHGVEALRWMREAANEHGMGVVTEVMCESQLAAVAEYADVLQIGARTMQAFALLKAVGAARMPVLLKRAPSATIDEWLLAGEHLLAAGAGGVIFCERGITGHDPRTRYTLDLAGAALLKHVHGQPLVVDPSHAVGRRDLVLPMCRAALASGADGLIVEVHPDPRQARSDGPQALDPATLQKLNMTSGSIEHDVMFEFGGVGGGG